MIWLSQSSDLSLSELVWDGLEISTKILKECEWAFSLCVLYSHMQIHAKHNDTMIITTR